MIAETEDDLIKRLNEWKVDQRKLGERLWKKTVMHVN